jgi:hypothetical protein
MSFLLPVWGFMKKISFEVWVIIAIVGAAIVGIYTVDRNAVKRTRAKEEVKDLQDTIVLNEASEEIVNEIETRVEHADEAVSRLPQFKSADELRNTDPELAALILADPERHER